MLSDKFWAFSRHLALSSKLLQLNLQQLNIIRSLKCYELCLRLILSTVFNGLVQYFNRLAVLLPLKLARAERLIPLTEQQITNWRWKLHPANGEPHSANYCEYGWDQIDSGRFGYESHR